MSANPSSRSSPSTGRGPPAVITSAASMTLLGDWNWWMPRFLDWIPRVTIEGDPDEPVDAAASA